MTTIGVDIEQFVADPYGSGIQRVLQYLAREWPDDLAEGLFVFPWKGEYALLGAGSAARLIDIAFSSRGEDLRIPVHAEIGNLGDDVTWVNETELPGRIDVWLLPEVSYLPSVLARFETMSALMPTGMIGYDALPMTEPGNYRFPPGIAANASEYFRLLASADSLVCISDYSREAIVSRLRRDPRLPTSVAHPGGDHVAMSQAGSKRGGTPTHFLRLGTLEERKMPVEIVQAFRAARSEGVDARLTYVGGRSSSYEWINEEVRRAEAEDIGFTWATDASDDDVARLIDECDVLVSFGTEGYGIPALEAIRRGKPVLFGGIQPAAQLMEGRGSANMGDPTVHSIKTAFVEYSRTDQQLRLRRSCEPAAIPTWREFARSVVEGIMRTA